MTHVYTRTRTVTTPACPYLACDRCGARVEGFFDGEGPPTNYPCGHGSGYYDICPSWGPVDGCACPKGARSHGDPDAPKTDEGKEQGPL